MKKNLYSEGINILSKYINMGEPSQPVMLTISDLETILEAIDFKTDGIHNHMSALLDPTAIVSDWDIDVEKFRQKLARHGIEEVNYLENAQIELDKLNKIRSLLEQHLD